MMKACETLCGTGRPARVCRQKSRQKTRAARAARPMPHKASYALKLTLNVRTTIVTRAFCPCWMLFCVGRSAKQTFRQFGASGTGETPVSRLRLSNYISATGSATWAINYQHAHLVTFPGGLISDSRFDFARPAFIGSGLQIAADESAPAPKAVDKASLPIPIAEIQPGADRSTLPKMCCRFSGPTVSRVTTPRNPRGGPGA